MNLKDFPKVNCLHILRLSYPYSIYLNSKINDKRELMEMGLSN